MSIETKVTCFVETSSSICYCLDCIFRTPFFFAKPKLSRNRSYEYYASARKYSRDCFYASCSFHLRMLFALLFSGLCHLRWICGHLRILIEHQYNTTILFSLVTLMFSRMSILFHHVFYFIVNKPFFFTNLRLCVGLGFCFVERLQVSDVFKFVVNLL